MTSLPTPLLGALLAALVTAIAGIIVAIIVARSNRRTATLAAERSAELARRDEQRRWNRERRSAAYGAFLEGRDRYVEAQTALGSDRENEQRFHRGDSSTARRVAEDCWKDLEKAHALLKQVGSPDAIQLAQSWLEELTARYEQAYVEGLFYIDDTREIERDDAGKRREAFVHLMHRELDG